jgi:hypothetical protein
VIVLRRFIAASLSCSGSIFASIEMGASIDAAIRPAVARRTSAGPKAERDVRSPQLLDVDAASRLPMQNVHCCMSDFAKGRRVGLCMPDFITRG